MDDVSYVDKQSEEQLVDALRQLPVKAGFITEEKTVSYQGEEYCWIIDPLDGTTNFIHHYAPSAISMHCVGVMKYFLVWYTKSAPTSVIMLGVKVDLI
jgi:Archaeal fructose-1,6-bisphosphatase and related enzymes of inositol monophosphatase family